MSSTESPKPRWPGAHSALLLLGLLSLRTEASGAAQAPAPSATSCQALQRGRRFPQPASFSVPLVGRPARHKPQLATRRDHLFRTTIRDAAAGDIDFAGHYAVAKWGCGTGCLGFVVVDVQTGSVYDPAFREVDFHYPTTDGAPSWTCFADMVNYSATSRLLVVEGCPGGASCGRHFFVMGARGLHEILYDPDLPETAQPANKTAAGKSTP